MRLSGLQKEVLSLYRSTLREIRKKPEWRLKTSRQRFRDFTRAEFDRNLAIDKRDFAAVEYLLRKGRRQLEAYSAPDLWKVLVQQSLLPVANTQGYQFTLPASVTHSRLPSFISARDYAQGRGSSNPLVEQTEDVTGCVGSSHHFPNLGLKAGAWSSRNVAHSDPNQPPASSAGATVAARKSRSAAGNFQCHRPSLLTSSAVAKPRPHQRNVIRKRRRSRIKARSSLSRSSTSGAAFLGANRNRALKQRMARRKNSSGFDGARAEEVGKPKRLHNWVTRHILNSKDDTDAAVPHYLRGKAVEISHPMPLDSRNDHNSAPTVQGILGSFGTDQGQRSLIQVQGLPRESIPWVQDSRPCIRSAENGAARFQGVPVAHIEYAHVGPLDGEMGYDGTASADEPSFQRNILAKPIIHRKPVPSQAQDPERTELRGREHIALVSSLPTSKREKRFGLVDPMVWGSVSRTLSQQHRLSTIVSSERSEKSSSILIEAQSRSSSKQKKLNRFTKELERYHAAHPKPADSSSGQLPSSPSLKTVSALVPYRCEFAAAGLAVTSKEQKDISPSKTSRFSRSDHQALAAQRLASPTASQLDGEASRPGGFLTDHESSSTSDIHLTPFTEIPGLLAEEIFASPEIEGKSRSTCKVLPWLCYQASETSASENRPHGNQDKNESQSQPFQGPISLVPIAAQSPSRKGQPHSRKWSVTEEGALPSSSSPAKGIVDKISPLKILDRELPEKVPPIPTKSPARPVERSDPRQLVMEHPTLISANKAPLTHKKGPSVQQTEVMAAPSSQSKQSKAKQKTVPRQRISQSAINGSARNTGVNRQSLVPPGSRSSTTRQQPPPIAEEPETSPSSTINFNKPLPKTPSEQKASYPKHKEAKEARQSSDRTKKEMKKTAVIQPEASPKYPRVGATSPPKLPHTWKYAIITDSSFEEALDAVAHKLEAIDDATSAVKIPSLPSASPTQSRQPVHIPPTVNITEPTLESQESSRQGLKVSVEESPSPAQPSFPCPLVTIHDKLVKVARKSLVEDQTAGNQSDCVGQPEAMAEGKKPPRAAQELFADHHDHEICDRDVLKGLRLAIEAACDEEFDAWIRNQTGLRLRRFMADLKGFEVLQRDAEAVVDADEAAIRAAQKDQPARRRRAEQRRQAAMNRISDKSHSKKGVC